MYRKFIYAFFSRYISYIIKKDFKSFTYNTPQIDSDKAILIIANHFSWWDGFLLFQFNKIVLKRSFHIMVTEENYNKVFFLKHMGAFPVKKNSRSVIKSLKFAGNLLQDRKNMLLIFPQGKLYSNHVNNVAFEKGLTYITHAASKSFQYLFAATFVDYFDKRKPQVTSYLESRNSTEFTDLVELARAYNAHYENSRQLQSRITV